EALGLGAYWIDYSRKHSRKLVDATLEFIIGVGSTQATAGCGIWVAGFYCVPTIERDQAAGLNAEREDLLLEQRPEVELLRVSEMGKAEEKAIGDEVAG